MTHGAAALLDVAPLRDMLERLNTGGEEARVVGGALRNALIGRAVHEYDITTTATPDVVIARATAAGLRAIPTGIAHGTVTVVNQGMPFEITTLREDVETDGRHAVIRFGRDFAQDALRRDFTINALSMGLDGKVHDYTGGLDDIAARRVRFIGDPGRRIREDYLRVLRFFRFSAEYAVGALDPEGLAAAVRERDGLALLSRERVRQEMLKLLAAPRAGDAIAAMADYGFLEPLLHGVAQPRRLARVIAIDGSPDGLLRLAALAVLVAEDALRLRESLRLSNQEAQRLERAAAALPGLHGLDRPPPPGDLRSLLFTAGRQAALDAIRLSQAESRAAADDSAWASARRFLADTPEPRLPFAAADLLDRGIARGPALGAALKALQGKWILAGFPQEPHRLAALLDEVTRATPSSG